MGLNAAMDKQKPHHTALDSLIGVLSGLEKHRAILLQLLDCREKQNSSRFALEVAVMVGTAASFIALFLLQLAAAAYLAVAGVAIAAFHWTNAIPKPLDQAMLTDVGLECPIDPKSLANLDQSVPSRSAPVLEFQFVLAVTTLLVVILIEPSTR